MSTAGIGTARRRLARLGVMLVLPALILTWRSTTPQAPAIGEASPDHGSAMSVPTADATLGKSRAAVTVDQLKRRPGNTRARTLPFAIALAGMLILGACALWMSLRRSATRVRYRRRLSPSGRSPPHLQPV